jgi:hypothetical protein
MRTEKHPPFSTAFDLTIPRVYIFGLRDIDKNFARRGKDPTRLALYIRERA